MHDKRAAASAYRIALLHDAVRDPVAIDEGAITGTEIADSALGPIVFNGEVLAGEVRIFA
jgi:hypothetical protein